MNLNIHGISPPPKGSFFETDSPHHTDWYRFAQDLSPIHEGVYDIKKSRC